MAQYCTYFDLPTQRGPSHEFATGAASSNDRVLTREEHEQVKALTAHCLLEWPRDSEMHYILAVGNPHERPHNYLIEALDVADNMYGLLECPVEYAVVFLRDLFTPGFDRIMINARPDLVEVLFCRGISWAKRLGICEYMPGELPPFTMECLAQSRRGPNKQIPSVEVIAAHCRIPTRNRLRTSGRSEVIALGDLAIKCGRISTEEIQNHCHASDVLDPTVVKVPKVHSHFTLDATDYLVMDRVWGDHKDVIEDLGTIEDIARIVNHLHSFTSDVPGPVGGGTYSGPLWSDDEPVKFTTKREMDSYVRSRLKRQTDKFVIVDTPLNFTHGDIAPRNLLFNGNGIWLLDWEFAGYFPRSAEIASLRLGTGSRSDSIFHGELEGAVLRETPLDMTESEQVGCWLELAVNHVRYYWPTEEERRYMWKPRRQARVASIPKK